MRNMIVVLPEIKRPVVLPMFNSDNVLPISRAFPGDKQKVTKLL